MTNQATFLDRAQQTLADLERRLTELGAREGAAALAAEIEATREHLKALRLQGPDPSEEAVESFARRLDELVRRVGTPSS